MQEHVCLRIGTHVNYQLGSSRVIRGTPIDYGMAQSDVAKSPDPPTNARILRRAWEEILLKSRS